MFDMTEEKTFGEFFRPGTWFNRFFTEKNLNEDKAFTFTDSTGTFNFMPASCVIEAISNASRREKAAIKDTLIRIDIANGDVMHFLEHLAKGMRENQILGAK